MYTTAPSQDSSHQSITIAQPHSIEAEQQLLGALLYKNDVYDTCVSGTVTAETFFDPLHAALFTAMEPRLKDGRLVSPVTMRDAFLQIPGSSEVGGSRYLLQLLGGAISPNAARDYVELLIEHQYKRAVAAELVEGAAMVGDAGTTALDCATQLENRIGEITSTTAVKPLIRSHVSTLFAAMKAAGDAYSGDAAATGVIKTGLYEIDNQIGGMFPGEFVVLGGRPAMGKTTLAQQIAFNVAAQGRGVFFGSLEMMPEQMGHRFLSMGMRGRGIRIPYQSIRRGDVSESEFREVIEEAKRQESMPIISGERDVRTVDRFRAAAKRAQRQFGDRVPLGLIICDYVQLLQDHRYRNKIDVVSAASDMLKSLAMEFQVPVIGLAQLSRAVEMRDPAIPMLSDLRESGSLEQDADHVWFCYRDAYYLKTKIAQAELRPDQMQHVANLEAAMRECENEMEVICAKNRSGGLPKIVIGAELPYCFCTSEPQQPAYDQAGTLL